MVADERPRCVATVLTYNNFEDTRECIENLRRLDPPCEVIVLVDNGSTDGSTQRLSKLFPDVEVARREQNMGFTAGANLAMSEGLARSADAILFVANDTVATPGLLGALAAALTENPRAGLVGPRVLEHGTKDTLQHGAGFIEWSTGRPIVRDLARRGQCDWVTGCGFLVRADALHSMAPPMGFDENFFLYWEDVDFSRRIASCGYDVLYEPRALLYHKESARTATRMSAAKSLSRRYYMARNQFLFARRHLSKMAKTVTYTRELAIVFPREVAACLKRNRGVNVREISLLLRARVDGLLGRTGKATYPGLYQ
jgi:GT2 family glycosyltransferase